MGLYYMYTLQKEAGWPWAPEVWSSNNSIRTYRFLFGWIFPIAESLVSVGVIFYAHKGIRTSSATMLRYVAVYVACKMFFQMKEARWLSLDILGQLDEAAIGPVVGMSWLLNLGLCDITFKFLRSLADELGKSQVETGSSSAV